MKTGVWSDFATSDKGADMIDLYVYVSGGTNIQAKDALAAMLGVQAGQPRAASSAPTRSKAASSVAAVSDFRKPPKAFPPRTPPGKDGKPSFVVAGDEGPKPHGSEKRRHFYRKGGVPVRVKIMNRSGDGLNAYRVTDTDGRTGWQFKKPDGYEDVPYFVADADPFAAEINRTIFWVEGEKDVKTVARFGGLAFTFGGTGDGLPSGCQQYAVGRLVAILADNDEAGRIHAEEKAALAAPVATGVKVIHFRELEDKEDVSDWAAIEGNALEALMARVEAAEMWKPSEAVAPRSRSIKISDFIAYLPMHSYIYIPTRDLWAAVAVNSQLSPMPVLNEDGNRAIGPATKDKSGEMQPGKPLSVRANVWLDRNQAVEQMTWAPGLPMLIHDRLISEGGWFDHPGATCFNLYRPPTIKHGDPAKAGRWVDHVKKVYPDDADHIIKWLAHHVQHPDIKVNHNLVIGGQVGVGKDTLLAPAVQAVGPWNCSEVSPEDLFRPFNGYLKAVLLRVSEALDMGDVSKFQLHERMKVMARHRPTCCASTRSTSRSTTSSTSSECSSTTNYKTEGLYPPRLLR
jgi:putative DNA primase/helicase